MTAQRRRHARERQAGSSGVQRALLRAGLTVSAVGAAVASGAGAAAAAPGQGAEAPVRLSGLTSALSPDSLGPSARGLAEGVGATEHATAGAVRPLKDARINPLAGTGVDPLDNTVGTQIADFKPVSTGAVTGPVSEGGTVRTLPVTGPVAGLLPG
ncbi:hypothetical protein ACLIYM_16170 [Streptomyces fenghuangensis]|uniref:hypothetical protein n=1 Tax=Streptomyces sp. ICN903 TaxID=2964654 RepID=UPI001EDB3155|nr:hypothetical protein [Streptomyces sp. ICN903]MCG3043113.1 hypothetical protein [Streptomyces sp. ICN903]